MEESQGKCILVVRIPGTIYSYRRLCCSRVAKDKTVRTSETHGGKTGTTDISCEVPVRSCVDRYQLAEVFFVATPRFESRYVSTGTDIEPRMREPPPYLVPELSHADFDGCHTVCVDPGHLRRSPSRSPSSTIPTTVASDRGWNRDQDPTS